MTDSTHHNNKRIAKNTMLLYFRMIIVMIVSLYTSRVFLEVLGIEDFGIYNIVGGIVTLLAFFQSSLNNASQRFFNVSIAKNDASDIKKTFSYVFILFFVIACVLVLFCETIGIWFVKNKLVIPNGKLSSAVSVFHFSVVSVFITIIRIPFISLVLSYQKFSIFAWLGLLEVFLKLVIVLLLKLFISSDLLVLYSALLCFSSLIITLFYWLYCIYFTNAVNISVKSINKTDVYEFSKFTSQNIFGTISYSVGVESLNIILNLFFGTIANAARGIAMQVHNAVSQVVYNLVAAFKPQMIQAYSIGNVSRTISLMKYSTQLTFILCSIFALPIILDTTFILKLWLGEIPQLAPLYTRLVLIDLMINVLTISLAMTANATGDIRGVEMKGRLFTLFIMPFAYMLLLFYKNPAIPFLVMIISSICYFIYCVFDVIRQLKYGIKNYFHAVIFPLVVSFSVQYIVCLFIYNTMKPSLIRLLFLVIGGCFSILSVSFLFLNKKQKNSVKKLLKNKIK